MNILAFHVIHYILHFLAKFVPSCLNRCLVFPRMVNTRSNPAARSRGKPVQLGVKICLTRLLWPK